MSLDVSRLEKARTVAGGYLRARCPACAENGGDRSGEHLRIYPDGRFGCCVHPEDTEHRRRIFALTKGDKPAPARPLPVREEKNLPRPDFRKLIETWSAATGPAMVDSLAKQLGVATFALGMLGACYSMTHGAWAFPMSDGDGDVVGVRLRWNDGKIKRCVTGSAGGALFIPDMEPQKTLWLCEGPTSTAAALTMGLWAIGRPNCSAGIGFIRRFIERNRVREAVIWADNDPDQIRPDGTKYNPGLDGANNYALSCPSTVLLTPVKDARVFCQLGGTRAQLESQLRGVIWKQP